MRVLQFARLPVVTVALVCVTLAGCGGSTPDVPFNPAGTSADMEAVNSTFASPTFTSFSTFSPMFDVALGGAPLISATAAALDIGGTSLPHAARGGADGMRAAAVRTAERLQAIMSQSGSKDFSASIAALPVSVAGKTFIYDVATGGYVASALPLLASNTVRFMLYAVDPVTLAPVVPLVETGHVDLIDLSSGSAKAARIIVVSGTTTYLDYTVSASSTVSSGVVSVVGYVTDGTTQANVNLRSTLTVTAGLTLTYSLDLPQRDVSIHLSLNAADLVNPGSTIVVSLLMSGPNGSLSMSGQLTGTSGTINVGINGHAFATITTNGSTTTITRNDGTPLADDELKALGDVFELSGSAFVSFDQMLAPVGSVINGA